MVKKRKGRCVKKNLNVHTEPEELVQAPHSFVIHKGLPGGHTLELTKDFRKIMEPFTASSLKERKKNTIQDFVSVAGPLHVSHLSIISRTEQGMYLKTCRLPRGPTLSFKIHNFSLARDVVSSLKKQLVVEGAFKHSPLVVLNGFSGEGLQMKLMASMFQNMFPTLNLTNVDLNNVRRCLMLNYNAATKLIDMRHYTIKVVPVGVSKGVKKVVQGKVPNLARCTDIADFFTKTGLLSESEAEDDPSNHVLLAQKLVTRGNIEAGKSSIRLSELGPRLTLQLIKIEDGLLDGEVLYHDLIVKSEEEKVEIERNREIKKRLKEKRKRIQEQNTRRKEQFKVFNKERSLQGMQKNEPKGILKRSADEANLDEPEDDDREYYRQEVGEEPDNDLFSAQSGGRKPPRTFHTFKNKRMRPDEENSNFDNNNKFQPRFRNSDENRGSFRGNKPFNRGGGRPNFNRDNNQMFNRGDRSFDRGGSSFNRGRGGGGRGGNDSFNRGRNQQFGGRGRGQQFGGRGRGQQFGGRGRGQQFGGRGRGQQFGGRGGGQQFGGRGRGQQFGGRGGGQQFGGRGRGQQFGDRRQSQQFGRGNSRGGRGNSRGNNRNMSRPARGQDKTNAQNRDFRPIGGKF